MATDYAEAVRHGAAAAARLHRNLGLREQLEDEGGAVNVFAVIHELQIPLLLRPLKGLLGVYLDQSAKGIHQAEVPQGSSPGWI